MSLRNKRVIFSASLIAAWVAASCLVWAPGIRAQGPRVHDPSTIVRYKGEYWIFNTGNGIPSWHSRDLVTWEEGPHVFSAPPDWVRTAVPGQRGAFWAPEITRVNGQYYLYYAVSRFGARTSAIGLATNPTLDPSDPDYNWSDKGIVVQSTEADNYNAIDPSIWVDADDRMWMAFGSFWSGIKLVELDPATGLRKGGAPLHALAHAGQIEASYLFSHGGSYFLFVNWGFCCRGVRSTYNIRVGRSDQITGPYLDKNGVDMLAGGGTLFLGTEGRYIGPGQTGILQDESNEWVSYHFYDGNNNGLPSLGLRKLEWDKDGWPVAGQYASEILQVPR